MIGGGVAGLAAAHRLCCSGAEVVLLDADRLGGKLRTSPFAGRPVDEAADAFLARVPFATDLARAVGLGDRLVAPTTGAAKVFVDERLVPLPAGHLLGIPTSADAPDLAAVLTPDALARLRHDLTAPGPPPGADDESIGGFIRRRLGDEVLERLVGPLVGGINAGDVDALSLAAVTPQIDAIARSGTASLVAAAREARARAVPAGDEPPAPVFLAPVGGMATFVAALVDDLRDRGASLHEQVAVRSLERLPAGWRVIADHSRGRGVTSDVTHEVDAVVLATPAPVTSSIIQDHAPAAAAHLSAIRHASVALVTLAIPADRDAPPRVGSGFLVPRQAGLLLTACSWSSSKWAALAPERGDGTELLRASAGRMDDRRIAELDDAALVERLVDDLDATMGLAAAPTAHRVGRWPSSFPQYAPGHLDRVAALEADVAGHAPTLAVAGNALRGVGIPASIQSGSRAAEGVLRALATSAGHR